MTKASDNPFPSILAVETASASVGTPSAGDQRLFIDTDHVLKYKNSSGTVTSVGAATASDLVQTYSGGGSIYIPGLRGSPDGIPGSPNAADDEFDAASTFSSVLGALDTNNTSDFVSHLHLVKNTSGSQIDGVYKASPSTPFTVTAKISAFLHNVQYHYPALMIGDATPTAWFTYGPIFTLASLSMDTSKWTNRTTRGTFSDYNTWASPPIGVQLALPPLYLKMVVTAGNNVTCSVSHDGFIWMVTHSGVDSGLTPAKVGVCLSAFASVKMEAVVDWVRFS